MHYDVHLSSDMILSTHALLPSGLVAQSVEQQTQFIISSEGREFNAHPSQFFSVLVRA